MGGVGSELSVLVKMVLESYCLADFLLYCYGHRRRLHSFPTRRSSDLVRRRGSAHLPGLGPLRRVRARPGRDRKSTRLNSSHEWSSYAVFCLKKKNATASPRRKCVAETATPSTIPRLP